MKLQNYNTTIQHGMKIYEDDNATLPKEELKNLLHFINHYRWMLQPSKGDDFVNKLDFNIFIFELIVKEDINISISSITLDNLLLIKEEIEGIILLQNNLCQLNIDLSEAIFTNNKVK